MDHSEDKVAGIITGSGAIAGAVGGKAFGPIPPDHPHYAEIREAYNDRNGARLLRLCMPLAAVRREIIASTEHAGRVTVQGRVVYFDGVATDSVVARRIVQLLDAGWTITPMVRFLERLMLNPSFRAVRELYRFLDHHALPITEDGLIVGYKQVKLDWTDWHTGKILNRIGDVIEMPRNEVDDNWGKDCSEGFHVGALSYIQGFYNGQGRCLVVYVDPADVVTVPSGETNKLRTCRYTVVSELIQGEVTDTNAMVAGPVYTIEAGLAVPALPPVPATSNAITAESMTATTAETESTGYIAERRAAVADYASKLIYLGELAQFNLVFGCDPKDFDIRDYVEEEIVAFYDDDVQADEERVRAMVLADEALNKPELTEPEIQAELDKAKEVVPAPEAPVDTSGFYRLALYFSDEDGMHLVGDWKGLANSEAEARQAAEDAGSDDRLSGWSTQVLDFTPTAEIEDEDEDDEDEDDLDDEDDEDEDDLDDEDDEDEDDLDEDDEDDDSDEDLSLLDDDSADDVELLDVNDSGDSHVIDTSEITPETSKKTRSWLDRILGRYPNVD